MFHLAGWFESINATLNLDIQPIPDDVLAIANNHFLPQQDMDLIFCYGQAANLLQFRLVSPTNRQITLPWIRPITDSATVPVDPQPADYVDNPFRIRGLEELAIEATASAAGPQDFHAVAGLQLTFEPVPRGNIFTLHGASTTASAADAWTTLAVTWDDILPEGQYIIVGGECVGVTEVAFRLILENQVWRPGAVATVLKSNYSWPRQRKGGLGVWGRFRPTRMPIVQILNSAAAVAVHDVYLDIMRVA